MSAQVSISGIGSTNTAALIEALVRSQAERALADAASGAPAAPTFRPRLRPGHDPAGATLPVLAAITIRC